jgi:hypothetical protein
MESIVGMITQYRDHQVERRIALYDCGDLPLPWVLQLSVESREILQPRGREGEHHAGAHH